MGGSPPVPSSVSVFSIIVSGKIDSAGGLDRFGDPVEIGRGIVEKSQRQS